jgi:acetyl esterase/lipase
MSWDNEVLEAAISLASSRSEPMPVIERGDWEGLRAFAGGSSEALEATIPAHSSISRRDFTMTSYDGADIMARWYTDPGRGDVQESSAVVYLHGGGMIMGSVQESDRAVAGYVADSGVPMLAVDYRLAPEYPHPTPVEDCVAALAWLHSQSASLGIDPERIAVMGDSAGGGLAAGTALLGRERGISIVRQILVYPMLDDRNITPDPNLADFAVWTYDNNFTGWHALLGDGVAGPEIPPYAAPARATDLAGLADAYIEVGELDIFRDESIDYARRLMDTGISAELHVHQGCPHGFDRVAPNAAVTRRARADRIRAIQQL